MIINDEAIVCACVGGGGGRGCDARACHYIAIHVPCYIKFHAHVIIAYPCLHSLLVTHNNSAQIILNDPGVNTEVKIMHRYEVVRGSGTGR